MKTNQEINFECVEVYNAIKEAMEISGTDYCQSWWLNRRNCNTLHHLNSREIVRRAKRLVDQGMLTIDKSKTSSATGTSYKLTDKIQ